MWRLWQFISETVYPESQREPKTGKWSMATSFVSAVWQGPLSAFYLCVFIKELCTVLNESGHTPCLLLMCSNKDEIQQKLCISLSWVKWKHWKSIDLDFLQLKIKKNAKLGGLKWPNKNGKVFFLNNKISLIAQIFIDMIR